MVFDQRFRKVTEFQLPNSETSSSRSVDVGVESASSHSERPWPFGINGWQTNGLDQDEQIGNGQTGSYLSFLEKQTRVPSGLIKSYQTNEVIIKLL